MATPPDDQIDERIQPQSTLGNNKEGSLSLVRAAAAASSSENPGNGGQFSQSANSASARTEPIAASTTDSIDVLLDYGSSKGTEAISTVSFSDCPLATPRLEPQYRIFWLKTRIFNCKNFFCRTPQNTSNKTYFCENDGFY
jgi:hypothetical protein